MIIPVVLLIFFGLIQGAVVLQANNVAQAAASTAYNSARLYDASSEDGVSAGERPPSPRPARSCPARTSWCSAPPRRSP